MHVQTFAASPVVKQILPVLPDAGHRGEILDKLELPFFLLDQNGRIAYANGGAYRCLKYPIGQLLGLAIGELDEALSDALWQHIKAAITNEGRLRYESHVKTFDGQLIPYEFLFQSCDILNGRYISTLAFDIASRKEVEADILAARESAMQNAEDLRDKTKLAEEALAHVRELKQKQDGDYYLTSMLLEPFQINRAKQGKIEVDWFIRQKTRFTYRKWQAEIGGDFVNADHVTLRGRRFTFFVIADAMGKANQGAGGALILATIVSAYLRRTEKTQHLAGLYPERWLRLLYEELQAAYEGFSGQMMVAASVGLVDEENRYLFFFNAEQPRPVSYISGVAKYVGSDNLLSKIGMPIGREDFHVELYRLSPGEKIIFGSDGRDDVRRQDTGEINFQDTFFLRLVEAAEGNLAAIHEATLAQAEIIDDYSLLSLQIARYYHEVKSATARELFAYFRETGDALALEKILERNGGDSQAIAMLANYYLKAGEMRRSIAYIHRYLDVKPDDLKAVYSLMRQYLALRDFEKAADTAERITHRYCMADQKEYWRRILKLLLQIYVEHKNSRSEIIRARLRS